MSNEKRHRGQLFDNPDKRKPSQPDMEGDGFVGGKRYAITAWKRENQLVLSLAPPRDRSNKYPPEEFRGALDAVRSKDSEAALWSGDIEGDDGTYAVQAFEKQGKSGAYLRLELEQRAATPLAPPAPPVEV